MRVVFKFPKFLVMASFSSVSITKVRPALKVIMIVIWTLVLSIQEAKSYSTFITYAVEPLVYNLIISTLRLSNRFKASGEEL